MNKIAALVMALGMTFAIAAPASAGDYGNPWCEIKHRVCENNPFYPSCTQAYQNCPNG